MTERQEKFRQLVGRGSGWVAVLSVIPLAVDALKRPVYPRGTGFAVNTFMYVLANVILALQWALIRHPDALGRELRRKVFGFFRPLAGLIFLAAMAVLPWSYFTHRPPFQVLMVFVCLLGATGLTYLIWLYHAHPERLDRRWKPDNK